jgi:uncharacterized protein (TIRG00374 family)
MKTKNFFDKVVLVLAATIIFYFAIILYSDYSSIDEKNITFNFQYIPIIIFLMIVHMLISSFKFYRLLQQLSKPISFKKSIKIFMGGLSLALTPGGLGTAIKSVLLKKQFNYSISSTFPIILIERWTELIAITVIISILMLWSYFLASQIILIFGILFVLVFGILISKSKTFTSIKKFILKIKFLKKLYSSIDESEASFKILMKKKNLFEIISISLSTKFIHLITVYLIFQSVGISIGFFDSGQIYYTSLLIGNLSFLPAGVIVTESGMIAMLVDNGIEFSLASLAVIFMRFIGTWIPAIAGTITYKFGFSQK